MSPASEPIPFVIEIPDTRLDELRRRLSNVEWPHDFANEDWSYGVPSDYLRGLVDEWRDDFDWRAQEAAMNEWPHFRAEIDGVPIHFLHAKGKGPDPVPLILTHGWPWTFWDFHALIGPLSDPEAYGGDPSDAFDVIVPSLPGFIFSTPLTRAGVSWLETADLWATLMRDVLGYERFAAHGGDWGAMVTTQIGHRYAEHLIGLHLTNAFPVPAFGGDRPWSIVDAVGGEGASPEEADRLIRHQAKFASHMATHMLHPQTLAYAMHDSPVGLLAWMLEKRFRWGDCRGDVESRFSREFLLTTMSLYWLTGSFVTSVRYYAEAAKAKWVPSREGMPQVPVPTGLSTFEFDTPPGPTDWARDYYDIRLEQQRDDGGHFAAAERPDAILEDLRALFRPLR